MSIKTKLEALIAAANEATGGSYTDLTAAVRALIAGQGDAELITGIIETSYNDYAAHPLTIPVSGIGLKGNFVMYVLLEATGTSDVSLDPVPKLPASVYFCTSAICANIPLILPAFVNSDGATVLSDRENRFLYSRTVGSATGPADYTLHAVGSSYYMEVGDDSITLACDARFGYNGRYFKYRYVCLAWD